MTHPIVIFAFDRLDYFGALLQSLKDQAGGTMAGREVHLFQDGAVCAWTGEQRTAREATARSVALFREAFPDGHVHFDDVNRGIALQWHRAEEFIFGTRGAQAAYMLEDDTVLGPHYLSMVDPLIDRARAHGRISYISAFGDHTAPLEAQRADARAMIPMNHIWGAAMLRDYWVKEREVMAPYYQLMARQPYRNRPHDEILQLLYRLYGQGRGTAQDSAKESASIKLGYARLSTKVCHAKYIGERGVHFSRSTYEHLGFDKTVLYPDPVHDSELPDHAATDRIVAEQDRLVQLDMRRSATRFPGLFATLATRCRVAVAPDRFLARSADGRRLVSTADPAAAAVLSVLSWAQEPHAVIGMKDAEGRWIGLDEGRSLAVLPADAGPSLFYRLPGMVEPFHVATGDSHAVAHVPAADGGPGGLLATARLFSDAAAFRLIAAG